jgi:AraC-like DNA-binding protein
MARKNLVYKPSTIKIHLEYISFYSNLLPFPDMPMAIHEQFFAGGNDTGLHKHEDHYALYLFSGGKGIHSINGHPYNVKRGDVYIASPGSVHAYREYSDLRCDAILFQTDVFLPQQLEALRSLSGFWNLRVDDADSKEPGNEDVLRHRLHLSPEQYRVMEEMLGELKREINSKSNNLVMARTLIPLVFFRLLVYLARIHEVHSQNDPPVAHEAGLAQVLRLCEERFTEPLTVPELAATMFLSPGRFSEVFSAQMGTAPGTYLRRLRLERAQTLLRTSNDTAANIAAQVGFTDAGQFSRAFRSAFGLTPLAYRSKFKK